MTLGIFLPSLEKSWIYFDPRLEYGTNNKDVLKVIGTLRLDGQDLVHRSALYGRFERSVRYESSGDVVFKASYSVKLTINSNFVHGALESLDYQDGKGKAFERVLLLGFSGRRDYEYSLMEKETGKDASFDESDNGDGDNLSVYKAKDLFGGWCYKLGYLSSFQMEYGKDCDAMNCNHRLCSLRGRH
ncbi:hypothetical protein MLD38_037008 [Melastoma candidum]|uniref:Uncharacterized protein n=1 Tax=Melastoma candidum TaxID=119954 RepID=A0ACB9LKR0_9MYRT|nr:hypothetical protein MLD38_037008 [Melastoma candidum]